MHHEPITPFGPKPNIYPLENGNYMCQLHKPVVFPCRVEGENLTALLTHA